jgi:putative transferase (TIGR04331 family)
MKQSRYLITTSDEKTWKFDRPVIFLGEWCLHYERRHIWQEMDAIVAKPYGLGLINKDVDHAKATAFSEELLDVLCGVLNKFHCTQHTKRFWRIFLGHWLRRYVDVMINRVKTLEQCLQSYEINGTTAYDINQYELAVQDSYSATWAFNDDQWNNVLNAQILSLLKNVTFPVEIISSNNLSNFFCNIPTSKFTIKRKILNRVRLMISKMANFFTRDSDAFIIGSYLPKKEEIKLNMALWQCPQYWASPKFTISSKPDKALRKKLLNEVRKKREDDFEFILFEMLFQLLPICYLEGFFALNGIVDSLPWPKTPKFIFTSSSFDPDEVFKLWTARKTEAGILYFIGQHGNMYGTHRHWHTQVEEFTADKFLTWGWAGDLPQHNPAFILKTAGKEVGYHNPQGGLLLIESFLPVRITTWDCTAEFANYFKEQQIFINELHINPKTALTVRLHSAFRYLMWAEKERWKAFDPSVEIDTTNVAIGELVCQSRLVVHSYDSTGILETLSQNIPTLAFWQNGFDHLRDNAKPYYQLLVDVGIIHLTPESVAQKVNEVWPDVEGWWGKRDVQSARKDFCEQYAKTTDTPIKDFLTIIR